MNLKDGCPGSNLLNVEASGTQMPISALSRHSSFLLDTLSVILRDTLRSLVFLARQATLHFLHKSQSVPPARGKLTRKVSG